MSEVYQQSFAFPTENAKRCSRCGESKPLSAFSPQRKSRDRRQPYCRECNAAQLREWRECNPDKWRAQTARTKANQRAAGRGDYSGDPALKRRARNKHLKAKYGITIEDETRMREAQGGRCAVCGVETRLVVDHCHATGKVRDLLCDDCNVALGRVNDDPELLRRLADYIERHRVAVDKATATALGLEPMRP